MRLIKQWELTARWDTGCEVASHRVSAFSPNVTLLLLSHLFNRQRSWGTQHLPYCWAPAEKSSLKEKSYSSGMSPGGKVPVPAYTLTRNAGYVNPTHPPPQPPNLRTQRRASRVGSVHRPITFFFFKLRARVDEGYTLSKRYLKKKKSTPPTHRGECLFGTDFE